jgi:hypothetical protein
MKSLTLQVEKSANEVESCCKLSLEDSLRDLSFRAQASAITGGGGTNVYRALSRALVQDLCVFRGRIQNPRERSRVSHRETRRTVRSVGRAAGAMTSRELWKHDREPQVTLSTGEIVYVELWRHVSKIQSRGVKLSIAFDGNLRIDHAERLRRRIRIARRELRGRVRGSR